MELLKLILTHPLYWVQHSLQEGVMKTKAVQQSTDSERGDVISSRLLPDTQIHSPALSLIPALWVPFRHLIQLTKLTISVLSIKAEKEESILGEQSQDRGRQGYAS